MKNFGRKILKIIAKKFGGMKKTSYLCNAKAKRAFSSAGSEHLPYKQRVGGSNPSTPTKPEGILLPAFLSPRQGGKSSARTAYFGTADISGWRGRVMNIV